MIAASSQRNGENIVKVNEEECQRNRLIGNGTSHAGTTSSLLGIIVKMRFRGDFIEKMTLR